MRGSLPTVHVTDSSLPVLTLLSQRKDRARPWVHETPRKEAAETSPKRQVQATWGNSQEGELTLLLHCYASSNFQSRDDTRRKGGLELISDPISYQEMIQRLPWKQNRSV